MNCSNEHYHKGYKVSFESINSGMFSPCILSVDFMTGFNIHGMFYSFWHLLRVESMCFAPWKQKQKGFGQAPKNHSGFLHLKLAADSTKYYSNQ